MTGPTQHPASNSESRKRIEELVERSSLGTPEAKALRASVTDEEAARVVQRARELADAQAAATSGCPGGHAGPCFVDRPDLCADILRDDPAAALATIRTGLAAAIAYAERHDGRCPVWMLRALLGAEGG